MPLIVASHRTKWDGPPGDDGFDRRPLWAPWTGLFATTITFSKIQTLYIFEKKNPSYMIKYLSDHIYIYIYISRRQTFVRSFDDGPLIYFLETQTLYNFEKNERRPSAVDRRLFVKKIYYTFDTFCSSIRRWPTERALIEMLREIMEITMRALSSRCELYLQDASFLFNFRLCSDSGFE